MNTVYIAGSWKNKEFIRRRAEELIRLGISVTSRWLTSEEANPNSDSSVMCMYHAHMDLEDVLRADLFVVDTSVSSTTGGYHVELGYAIGLGKSIYIVGHRENIFQYLAYSFDNWESFFNFIREEVK